MRDVLVAGGGPAGSVTAVALRKLGLDVELVEKDSFPRHHIGESLLSRTVPYLKDLGLWGAIERQGFVEKPGALFRWGRSTGLDVLDMPSPGYAYQVSRARFDEVLLDAARDAGAAVGRGRVVDAAEDADGVTVTIDAPAGVVEHRARYVVDATGAHRLTAHRSGIPLSRFDGARCAVSAYVTGARRPDGGHEGRIVTEASENGWLWFIPLDDRTTSVGFVTDGRHVRSSPSPTACLLDELPTGPYVDDLLRGSEPDGPVRLIRYTNYIADGQTWTGRTIRVGDAAMFVDPLFSTGVHGAVLSAHLVAACLGSLADGTVSKAEAIGAYGHGLAEHFFRTRETVRLLYGFHRGPSRFWRERAIPTMDAEEARQSVRTLGVGGTEIFRDLDHHLYLPDAFADELRKIRVPRPLRPMRAGDAVALRRDAPVRERLVVSRSRLRAGWVIGGDGAYTAAVPAVTTGGQGALVRDLVADGADGRPTVLGPSHSLVLAGALVATANATSMGGPDR